MDTTVITEHAPTGQSPDALLRQGLSRVRDENQRDLETLQIIQGRRYRELFEAVRETSPASLPEVIELRSDQVFVTKSGKVLDLATNKEADASDSFWGAKGYELLVKLSFSR